MQEGRKKRGGVRPSWGKIEINSATRGRISGKVSFPLPPYLETCAPFLNFLCSLFLSLCFYSLSAASSSFYFILFYFSPFFALFSFNWWQEQGSPPLLSPLGRRRPVELPLLAFTFNCAASLPPSLFLSFFLPLTACELESELNAHSPTQPEKERKKERESE